MSGRILIVEDDVLISMDLEDELMDRGFDAVGAATVAAAQRVLAEETPSFALLDMHLKDETTFELAARLRGEGIPYIFISGNDAGSLPEELKSSRILTKPVSMDVLAATMEEMQAEA